MPTLSGLDEQEAAQLAVEFMEELARKLQQHHSTWWGYSHPHLFRGRRLQWGRALEDHDQPIDLPNLMNLFIVEMRKRGQREWKTFASFTLWRADWDETPEMRSATCTLYYPDMTPLSFQQESREFIKTMFGCEKVRFFTA